jgi:cholinesterase
LQPLWASHTRFEGDNVVPYNASAEQGIDYETSGQATLTAFHCPTMLATMYRIINNVTTYRNVWSGDFRAITPYPWMRGAYHAADVYLMFGGAPYTAYEDFGGRLESAYRYHQDAVASFVRDPREGLGRLGWPKYDGTGKTLVDMFPSKGSEAIAILNATAFDEPCQELYAQFTPLP